MRATLGFIGLFATLCSAQQPLISGGAPDEIKFTQIEVGTDSPMTKSGVYVYKTKEEFHDYLKKIDELNLKLPKIDWEKNQIIAVHLEGASNSFYSLNVKRLHVTSAGKVDVEFELGNTAPSNASNNQGHALNLSTRKQYPYAILQIPKMEAKWTIKVVDG